MAYIEGKNTRQIKILECLSKSIKESGLCDIEVFFLNEIILEKIKSLSETEKCVDIEIGGKFVGKNKF